MKRFLLQVAITNRLMTCTYKAIIMDEQQNMFSYYNNYMLDLISTSEQREADVLSLNDSCLSKKRSGSSQRTNRYKRG